MSTERPYWNPGPPPAPDGLRDAFQRAHRRRVRTAATTSLPVVLSAAMLASLPLAGGGSTSLDSNPADQPTAIVSAIGDDTVAADRVRPGSAGQAGPAGAHDVASGRGGSGTAGANGTDPVPASPLPTVLPTFVPPARDSAYLDVSATGTKSTHIDLAEAVTVHPHGTTFTTSGSYAGLYLVSDDGATSGGVFLVPTPERVADSTSQFVDTVGTFSTLPAGGYTAYVVGTGSVRVQVPVGEGQPGLVATATDPATAYFNHVEHAFGPAEVEADVRLAVTGDATSVGIAGAWMYGGSRTHSQVNACLSEHDAACGPDDPRSEGGATVSIISAEGAFFAITDGLLNVARDVYAQGTATAPADARLWAWYVVLDL